MKSNPALSVTLFLLASFGLWSSFPAEGQTLVALTLERSLDLNNVLTTRTQSGMPTQTVAAINAGALEMREQINYNPTLSTLTSTLFAVPAGAPNPTNLNQLPFGSFIGASTMSIDKINIASTPYNAVELIGTVLHSTDSPYGNYMGALETFSFGFTSDRSPTIKDVIETYSGAAVIYTPSSKGNFTIVRPAATNGGSALSININGISSPTPTFTTALNQITLDASGSTPANATFAWSVLSGSAAISFLDGRTSVANVQLVSGRMTYLLKLTVTDSKGATSTAMVTINFF